MPKERGRGLHWRGEVHMRSAFVVTSRSFALVAGIVGCLATSAGTSAAQQQAALSPREALIARAKALELNTPYVPPPGDALEHHASGFAKVICSAVFVTGLDPDFAAENVGYFTSAPRERAMMSKPVIDRAGRAVHVRLPNGVTRTAKYLGSQGCVTVPLGQATVSFAPVQVTSRLPVASTQPWPMGDVLPKESLPKEVDAAKVQQAVNA